MTSDKNEKKGFDSRGCEKKAETGEAVVQNDISQLPVSKVIVHPLVLLSVVDHYNRVSKLGHVKRVVGVLLGSWQSKTVLDVSNSFAIPFDEDESDSKVWFVDHDYLCYMYNMFKKVNAREKIVGWYHTGPKLHQNDILINDLMKQFAPNSVLVIVDVKPRQLGLPTEAYVEVEEVQDDGTKAKKTFEHVPSEIGAEEAEEVGVEHLLRDIKDLTVGTLSQKITDQLGGIKGLESHLNDMNRYLNEVVNGELPINQPIISLLQDVLNLLPDIMSDNFMRSTNVQMNDQLLAVYMGSLIRAVIALHNLINNKLSLKEIEKKENDKITDKAKEKEDKTKKEDKEKSEKTDNDKKTDSAKQSKDK